MEYLSGIIERITFVNEENGFSVIKLKSKGFSDLVTVVGNLPAVNIGAIVKLSGEWKNSTKYGKQFSVVFCKEEIPATVYGIEKYLGSGLIKGIGPKNAKRIVAYFKEHTINIIEEMPDRLIEVDGIGKKRVDMIIKAWDDQKEIKNIMLFLQGHGVSTTFAVKIFKQYGNKSIDIVKNNPYQLADDIWGIGFRTADQIAEKMGYDKNSYERARAGIIYFLNQWANDGHCFSERENLIIKANELLEIDEAIIANAMGKMIENNDLVKEEEDIFLPVFYHCENGTAVRILELSNFSKSTEIIGIDEIVLGINKKSNIKYDEYQLKAIEGATKSNFMVITGGPGTGKTTVVKAIINIFIKAGLKVLLAAPTGRAAKRLNETTGMQSKTIHRLLEYSPSEGYKKGDKSKLDCDVLIVDETSMIDIVLMYNLLKAVEKGTAVLLIGDVDQLPSVGPGNVLRDIINSGAVNVVRFERIFRQAAGSSIITNAHRINKGMLPNLKWDKSKQRDFFFIEEEEQEKIVEIIKDLCVQRLPDYYKVNPINDIQVLCPMQRGLLGTININKVLQEVLNPSDICVRCNGVDYKENDKVMQIKNNYDKNVFNGDIGQITNINKEDRVVFVRFDENQVEYDFSELDELVHAYATTIHKSQGSEYKIVISPITTSHYVMLKRNLLYTCVTRAKKIFIIIGSVKAIALAVKNNDVVKRNTKLELRLSKNIKIEDK